MAADSPGGENKAETWQEIHIHTLGIKGLR